MLIKNITVGPMGNNCIVLACPKTMKGVIVDPGSDAPLILRGLEQMGKEGGKPLKVEAILLTHGHVDHFGVAASLVKATGAPLFIHKGDLPIYRTGLSQGTMLGLQAEAPPTPDTNYLKDGQELTFGDDLLIKVIHTPGHSKGSVCFLAQNASGSNQILISGDTLFAGGIGRTDLPGGDHRQLLTSIKKKLFVLPDELKVIPGHGPPTTIGHEKMGNPWLRGL